MGLEALRAALPAYARDLRLNLGTVIGGSPLPPQQRWGTVLVCAIAARSGRVLRELAPEARAALPEPAYTAARAVAATMAISNVFHRTRHQLSDPEYRRLRAGLRMNVLGDPGVPRADVELWSLGVSAVNGCSACLDSHEKALRGLGVDRQTIQEAVKIAAVIHAAAVTLDAEEVLGETGPRTEPRRE
ncbi:carboxymuconolactone decarboxylase family protein [Streptomyces sp. YIM 98790]|uniref:carboxymuconolactone decarboxylase family protein n=1 Tax=Streptomyces sp. YIM 98790 TaxID=2689077 RepID=UPI0014096A2A|nr:carboxymuconolactone decarboxylase family protein [Streptomyces sp. YIM 98790]